MLDTCAGYHPGSETTCRGILPIVGAVAVIVTTVLTFVTPPSAAGSGPSATALTSQGAYIGTVAAVVFSPKGGGWEASANGSVASFGGATSFGSLTGHLNRPIVGMAATRDGHGYWLVASDGGIFAFGDAHFYGSTGSIHLNKPIVGMAATPDGHGYWLVASDGGIFTAGDAGYYGSLAHIHLNRPIVGMAATPDGHGYWLVASDGGIFTVGDAGYDGSLANIHLNRPIVGMAATSDGHGYWLVASDGGVFNVGDAGFYGSGVQQGIGDPVIGMISSSNGHGYCLFRQDGAGYAFGNGSTTNVHSASASASEAAAPAAPQSPPPKSTSTSTSTTTTSLATPPVPSPEFVSRNGTDLTLDGQPYRFTGINIYMAASGGTPSSCGGELYPNVGVPLADMPNGVVIRLWAFQDFFVSNGTWNWTNLDQVLAIAAAHDDKIIPVLANQHDYCDGPAKDLGWYQSGYKDTVEPGDLVSYRQFVADIVSRYSGNPSIAMWQLVNEGEAVNGDGSCDESAALTALLAFTTDVGGMVHTLDPNHLVSLGVIAGYNGSGGGAQWCGAANGDYQTLMASPSNDICDFHDYGYPTNPMGNPATPDLATAIQMCHADNRPIMVAETGIYADRSAELPIRATEFSAKFSAQFQAGVVGELLWNWAVEPDYVSPDQDPDYGISPGDPSLGVLAEF